MKRIVTIVTAIMLLCSTYTGAENISGSWVGTLEAGSATLKVVFNIQKDANGKEYCTMDSPDQSAKGFPATLLYLSADSVSIKLPALNISYNGKLTDGEIKGIFSQNGMNLTLNLKPGVVEYVRPQTPAEPYPYQTKEVTFTNPDENVILSGTITYPVGYKESDNTPILLMVSGSGGQDRDSELYGHKLFLVIADYLARNGIATLRYDDRAIGRSTGRYQAATTQVVADDAQAGILFLRQLNEFSKIGVLGHSEGGNIAFILGAKQLIDFAVCMAGTSIPGDDCLYEQSKLASTMMGVEFTMTKEQFNTYLLSQGNTWLDYFLKYNPELDIKNTSCPVFVLNGDKDIQVISALNIPAFEEILPEHKQSKVQEYPGLNHLFQECNTGLPDEYSSIEQTISPVVLKDIVDWIKEL